MAFVGRLRSSLPIIRKIAAVDSFSSAPRCAPLQNLITNSQLSRNYATESALKEQKVKVPLTLFGASGNYASALFIAATKINALDKVESELIDFVEAAQKSPSFSVFLKDLSVSKDTRVKVMTDICSAAKFSDITRNVLVILAENGRLMLLQDIKKKFSELTMSHRGEVTAIVTTAAPIQPQEEKEASEKLDEVVGKGKKVIVEYKVDPSILGGLVIEYSQKVLDMSMRNRKQQFVRLLREPVNWDNL